MDRIKLHFLKKIISYKCIWKKSQAEYLGSYPEITNRLARIDHILSCVTDSLLGVGDSNNVLVYYILICHQISFALEVKTKN